MMTHANYRYDIMAFQTPRYYVAQVTEWDLRTNTFETWLYTADDLRTLVTRGTGPIKINLVHGTTHQWFDDIVNSKPIDKVAIVGSRDYPNKQAVIGFVNSLPPDSVVVSGRGRGVDTWAEQTAISRGLPTEIFPAEWDKYGKSAGFRRNADIVKTCTRLVAFWDGKSKGTAHSVGLARKSNKPVEIIRPSLDLDSYFDMSIPDEQAQSMLDEVA